MEFLTKLFARDSWLWKLFFYGGLVVMGLSAAPKEMIDTFPRWVDSTMPTIRLLAFVATILGGKFGLSWFPASDSGSK